MLFPFCSFVTGLCCCTLLRLPLCPVLRFPQATLLKQNFVHRLRVLLKAISFVIFSHTSRTISFFIQKPLPYKRSAFYSLLCPVYQHFYWCCGSIDEFHFPGIFVRFSCKKFVPVQIFEESNFVLYHHNIMCWTII